MAVVDGYRDNDGSFDRDTQGDRGPIYVHLPRYSRHAVALCYTHRRIPALGLFLLWCPCKAHANLTCPQDLEGQVQSQMIAIPAHPITVLSSVPFR